MIAKLKSANVSVLNLYAYISICVTIPYVTAKFKSANIFISVALDQTAKFKDRQYFQLYGVCLNFCFPGVESGGK